MRSAAPHGPHGHNAAPSGDLPEHANHTSSGAAHPPGCTHHLKPVNLPIRTFTHDDRTITIYATMHVAPHRYWEALHAELLTYANNGTEIHYEGTNLTGAPALWKLPGAIASIAARLPAQLIVRTYPTLQTQRQGLADVKAQPTARRVDLPQVRMLKAFRFQHWIGMTLAALTAAPLIIAPRRAIRAIAKRKLDAAYKYVHTVYPNNQLGSLDRIVIEDRDKYAINAAIKQSGDVVLVWGLRHLPGMTTQLESHGWQITETRHLYWGAVCPECGPR